MKPARAELMAAVALLAPVMMAQQSPQTVVVQVHVTSVSGRDVYLDLGRTAGLAPGQTVRLYPSGTAEVQALIRTVSATSCRAELVPGAIAPTVGSRGEVEVPKPKPSASPQGSGSSSQPSTSRPVPAHPPWQRQVDPLRPDQPLLVPTFGQKPDDRPATLDGRVFLSSQYSRDDGGDRANSYWLTRMGFAGEANNAMGYGERTRFAGEVNDRRASVPGEVDDGDSRLRIDQLSTSFGTERWSPYGAEVGRFLSQHLPEIGLVDGAEGVMRYGNGVRIGGGLGAYPVPYPDRQSGDDVGIHAFIDYTSDERRTFAAAAGVQKTWHLGAADRDLLLFRVESHPAEGVTLFGSAKVDWYTGGDDRKSGGFQVTEFFGQARWDGVDKGAGLSLSHFAWPDLLRGEYKNLPDELVRDGKVDRLSPSLWFRVHQDVRLSGRFDIWQDQDASGTAFELGVDWNNIAARGTSLTAQVFRTDGGAQSGPGLRLLARRQIGEVFVNAGYRWYGYDVEGLLAGPESYTRQSIDVGASWMVGECDLNLQLEHWFGDQENAYAIALYAQWRF